MPYLKLREELVLRRENWDYEAFSIHTLACFYPYSRLLLGLLLSMATVLVEREKTLGKRGQHYGKDEGRENDTHRNKAMSDDGDVYSANQYFKLNDNMGILKEIRGLNCPNVTITTSCTSR